MSRASPRVAPLSASSDRPGPGTSAGERDGLAGVLPDVALALRTWRDALWQRTRSFGAQTFFETLSGAASLLPAASPERHGIEVERDLVYGDDHKWHRLDIYRPVERPGPWPVVLAPS